MAESKPFGKTLKKGSDILPDIYCDPCYDHERDIIQAAGLCKNCSENLCPDCVFAHKRNKFSRHHKIQDRVVVLQKPLNKDKKPVTEKCHQHEEEALQLFCRSCDQVCCKICQTVNHHSCNMQSLTNAADNIKNSQKLKVLEKKIKVMKKGYDNILNKAVNQSLNIDTFYTDAISEMRKLQEKFEKLFTETVKRAEIVKDEDLKTTEAISTTCNILGEQLNKISSNLDHIPDNTDNEMLFISIKRAERQIKPLEDRLKQLETENTITKYMFEPEEMLNGMLDELSSLGELSFSNNTNDVPMLKTPVLPAPMLKTPVLPAPMLKTPSFFMDIAHQSPTIRGCILLKYQSALLLTDLSSSTLKMIDLKQNKIVLEFILRYSLWDLTQIKVDEFAISCPNSKKILFVSLSSGIPYMEREMSVDGWCYGLEYNDHQDNLIVTFDRPPKVEILSLTGTVIKRFDKDENRSLLFTWPVYVALSHDKTMIYVTDNSRDSVTLMTLNGDVKAVYTHQTLHGPRGVCVNRFGIVYVVGYNSDTVLQIVPGSDKLEPLLGKKELKYPMTVTYCDVEDKLYLGLDIITALNL